VIISFWSEHLIIKTEIGCILALKNLQPIVFTQTACSNSVTDYVTDHSTVDKNENIQQFVIKIGLCKKKKIKYFLNIILDTTLAFLQITTEL
jgi:hypothetical protein